MIVETT